MSKMPHPKSMNDRPAISGGDITGRVIKCWFLCDSGTVDDKVC